MPASPPAILPSVPANASLIARILCGALTLAAAAAVWRPPRAPARRWLVWIALAALGLAAIAIPLQKRLTHSNLAHYYLGAKYRMSYFDFYRIAAAGLGKPQVGQRDLRQPDRMVRSDPRAQRLYYVEMLQRNGSEAAPDDTLDSLRAKCETRGLIAREASEILRSVFDAPTAEAFRVDLAAMQLDTDDNGFNGSPLYVLFRKLDPSIHRPFDPLVGLSNIALQLLAMALLVTAAGIAFRWPRETRLMVAAIFLASWDFSGWALNGLSFAGWVVPFALLLIAYHRRHAALAGAAIACAGLMKLFPFILLLPPAVFAARSILRRYGQPNPAGNETRDTVRAPVTILLAAAAATFALAAAAIPTGWSWCEFLQKIGGQFTRSTFIANTVGLSQLLLGQGIHRTVALIAPQLTIGLALLAVLFRRPLETMWDDLPRLSVLLIACMGWLTGNWFNYYAIVSLLMIPFVASRNRPAAAGILALFGVGFLLPDYHQCYLTGRAPLAALKAAPYMILPLYALALEIGDVRRTAGGLDSRIASWINRHENKLYAAGTLASIVLICGELYRVHTGRAESHVGRFVLEQRGAGVALPHFERAARLLPEDTQARMNYAVVLEKSGREADAAAVYEEIAALDPGHAAALSSLGRIRLREGRLDESVRLLGLAAELAPHDEIARINLAAALIASGRPEAARPHLLAALAVKPDFDEAARLLAEIGDGSPGDGASRP